LALRLDQALGVPAAGLLVASQRRHSSTDPNRACRILVAKVAFERELLCDVL